jgi:HPr kinase/phosphorylase
VGAVVLVEALLQAEGLDLELCAGRAGLGRKITGARVQKPGLALTGYTATVHPERIQVLGLTEISYLQTLDSERRAAGLAALCDAAPAALVITRGLQVPDEAGPIADARHVPLLRTPLISSVFISRVTRFLDDRLAPTTSVHGVLVDVLGIGVLILGKSGIGKSEAALDLVMRGNRLVADDIVEIHRHGGDSVYGAGSEMIRHHMEIRGLGIINVKDLFGISAVRDTKKIELVAELVDWNEDEQYDRLGTDDRRHPILDVPIPMVRVPIRPGRNIASLLEVAARNQLLKFQGKHSAREFQDRINRAVAAGAVRPPAIDEVE